jgi:hypothetical protein
VASIIIPNRWSRQPVGPVSVRPEFARSIEFCIDFRDRSRIMEIHRSASLTIGSAMTRGFTPAGTAVQWTDNDLNSFVACPLRGGAIGTGNFTFHLIGMTGRIPSGDYPYVADFGSGFALTQAHADTANKPGLYDGSTVKKLHDVASVTGKFYRSLTFSRSGTTCRAYWEGINDGTSATSSVSAAGTSVNIGGFKSLGVAALHTDWKCDFALLWRVPLRDAEIAELGVAPYGALFTGVVSRIYFDLAGGATARTVTSSLDSAVQYSRTATASIDSAIQVGLTGTVSLSAAISQALTATATLEAAIQAARTASASVDAMVTAGTTASTSIDAALQVARTASATLDAAVQIARTATASVDGAVQRALTASASLDGYVQAGTTALASLDAAVQYARTGTASLDAALSIARTAAASLDADIVVSSAGTVTASLDAALAIVVTATASLDAAIRHARTAVASLDGYVYDSSATEAEGYTFKASARAPFRASRRVVH